MKRMMVLILAIKGVWLNRIVKAPSLNQLNQLSLTHDPESSRGNLLFTTCLIIFANETKLLKSENKMVPESTVKPVYIRQPLLGPIKNGNFWQAVVL